MIVNLIGTCRRIIHIGEKVVCKHGATGNSAGGAFFVYATLGFSLEYVSAITVSITLFRKLTY